MANRANDAAASPASTPTSKRATSTEPPSALQRRAQTAWEAFCEELKQAGRQLIREDLPLGELDAAEGLRYLSRLVRTGLERHVETADPAEVYLHGLCNERLKGFGGDNPDSLYFGAALNGEHVYRLRADFRGCVHVSLIASGLDERGTYQVTGNLDSHSLPEARLRPIDVAIGPVERASAKGREDARHDAGGSRIEAAPAVLTTTRETTNLLVRCTFASVADKDSLRLSLTRTDSDDDVDAPPLRLGPIENGLLATAKFVRGSAETWTNQSVALRQRFNQLPLQDPERIRKAGGDPSVFYYGMAWSVAEDEFLVVRLTPMPECTTWGFQLNNLWTESLDYTRAPIHLNKRTAVLDPDGGITIVVSERDPGRANWLRTLGHRSGTANLRIMGAKEPVGTEVRVVGRKEEIQAWPR